jgi:hypothetical protein
MYGKELFFPATDKNSPTSNCPMVMTADGHIYVGGIYAIFSSPPEF